MEKLMVYLPMRSSRAEYIFPLMIRDLIGAEMMLTDRLDDYLSYPGPRLEYAADPSGKGIFFSSCGLLAEKSIQPQQIEFMTFQNNTAFFPVRDIRSAF
jgi:hypothetical protein